VPDEQVAAAPVDQAFHPLYLLAAEDGALTFPQFTTPLLVATVAAVVLWVLLLAAAFATRARGVDPGPATMELGEEPPAVVDLLTNDWRVTADAVPATLLDLAARDHLDLEQYGPGRTVCRVRRTSGEGLRPTSGWCSTTSPGWPWTGSCRRRRSPPVHRTSRGARSSVRWWVTPANGGWPATAGAGRPMRSSGRPRWCPPGSGSSTPTPPAAWTPGPSAPGR
jgi:hypothetical protein